MQVDVLLLFRLQVANSLKPERAKVDRRCEVLDANWVTSEVYHPMSYGIPKLVSLFLHLKI